MNVQTRIDEALKTDDASLADGDVFIDNDHMINGPTKILHQPLVRHIEYRLVSLGMSVIAYLFERVILRSIQREENRPRHRHTAQGTTRL